MESAEKKGRQSTAKRTLLVIAVVLVLILTGLSVLFIRLSPDTADMIRDIAVVFYVVESLVVIVCLAVLISQLIRFVNTLQGDIVPILKTTNETANHIKGTVTFLGNNLVEPTIKASSTAAGVRSAAGTVVSIIRAFKK